MIVDAVENHRNRVVAWAIGSIGVGCGIALSWLSAGWLLLVPASVLLAVWIRYRTARRFRLLHQPFPKQREKILQSRVEFFRALDSAGKQRFRDLVTIFLDEVAITGIKTDVDETTRVLVAASAAIPIFGFDDWEYSGLGEVLIYPASFDSGYQTEHDGDQTILGMVGTHHLSGVMILSKPSLLAGFDNRNDKRNVGIHEFAHLVDKQDGQIDGLPPGVSIDVYQPWVTWVGEELRSEAVGKGHIDDYAYTNEAEYFAVLSEYFFESPSTLQKKNPHLYALMQKMYRQDPQRILKRRPKRRRRVGRNDPCPCGSQEKYKRCCRPVRQSGK